MHREKLSKMNKQFYKSENNKARALNASFFIPLHSTSYGIHHTLY